MYSGFALLPNRSLILLSSWLYIVIRFSEFLKARDCCYFIKSCFWNDYISWPLTAIGIVEWRFTMSYWFGAGTLNALSGLRSRNEPEPKGTEPIFHDILRYLSVSTPHATEDGFELRLNVIESCVEALGDDLLVWYIPGASLLWTSRSCHEPLLSLSNQTEVFLDVLYILN